MCKRLRIVLVFVLSLPAAWSNAERFDFYHENVLGSSFHLQIEADSQAAADVAEAQTLAEIDRLAAIFSSYDASSELSKFLSLPMGATTEISTELFDVLSECERWISASKGAFNPAVEVLSQEWKRASMQGVPPDAAVLAALAEEIAASHWKLDESKPNASQTGRLVRRAMRTSQVPISLNAIAKGYILDRAAESAMGRSATIQSAMNSELQDAVKGALVSIGGDIRVAGKLEATVSVADPRHDAVGALPVSTQMVSNAGIATSGNSERGFRVQNKWYSHVIDARTGIPVSRIVSATVIAPTACTADALATTCSVMETSASLKLIDSIPGAACMLISVEGEVYQSARWPAESPSTSPDRRAETRLIHFQAKPAETQMWIEFEITKAENSGRYRRPYVAVWVEDKDGFPVKTLLLFLMKNQPGPRWHRDLRRWYADDQMRLLVDKTDIIDAVSKPTRNPGQYKVEWDGLDDAGKPLKDGEYTLFIEAAREHGTYQLMKHKFELGGKAFEESLKGNAEISSASIKYKVTRN